MELDGQYASLVRPEDLAVLLPDKCCASMLFYLGPYKAVKVLCPFWTTALASIVGLPFRVLVLHPCPGQVACLAEQVLRFALLSRGWLSGTFALLLCMLCRPRNHRGLPGGMHGSGAASAAPGIIEQSSLFLHPITSWVNHSCFTYLDVQNRETLRPLACHTLPLSSEFPPNASSQVALWC